jgi:hypothetical protein
LEGHRALRKIGTPGDDGVNRVVFQTQSEPVSLEGTPRKKEGNATDLENLALGWCSKVTTESRTKLFNSSFSDAAGSRTWQSHPRKKKSTDPDTFVDRSPGSVAEGRAGISSMKFWKEKVYGTAILPCKPHDQKFFATHDGVAGAHPIAGSEAEEERIFTCRKARVKPMGKEEGAAAATAKYKDRAGTFSWKQGNEEAQNSGASRRKPGIHVSNVGQPDLLTPRGGDEAAKRTKLRQIPSMATYNSQIGAVVFGNEGATVEKQMWLSRRKVPAPKGEGETPVIPTKLPKRAIDASSFTGAAGMLSEDVARRKDKAASTQMISTRPF